MYLKAVGGERRVSILQTMPHDDLLTLNETPGSMDDLVCTAGNEGDQSLPSLPGPLAHGHVCASLRRVA